MQPTTFGTKLEMMDQFSKLPVSVQFKHPCKVILIKGTVLQELDGHTAFRLLESRNPWASQH